jgi:hypothetical protein
MWTPPLHVNLKCGVSNQAQGQEIPIKLSEISNLFKVEHQSGSVMPLTLTGPKPE